MGAVAAPPGRGFARLPAVTAALVGAAACAILVVSPSTPPLKHPAYGAATRNDPHRVTFRGLGTTYVAASGRSGGGFLAFTDVMNTGDHRVTITGVDWTLQHAARLEDIALKRIGRGGATFGPRLIEAAPPFHLPLAPGASLEIDYRFTAPGCRAATPRSMPGRAQPMRILYRSGGRPFTATILGAYVPTRCR
jgi:hypothetical protein